MRKLEFEKLSAEASLAMNKAEDALRKMLPEGTHGRAFFRHGQVNPSPATVRGIAHGTSGMRGWIVVELDEHKARSRYTYRAVHYTKFVPDPS